MPLEATCHCGQVRITLPTPPVWVADCNCSLCRRLGWRLAYYPPNQVTITGETKAYIWGDRMISIHHCPTCGCNTHWQDRDPTFEKMGINARLLENFDETQIEVRKLDNAD